MSKKYRYYVRFYKNKETNEPYNPSHSFNFGPFFSFNNALTLAKANSEYYDISAIDVFGEKEDGSPFLKIIGKEVFELFKPYRRHSKLDWSSPTDECACSCFV